MAIDLTVFLLVLLDLGLLGKLYWTNVVLYYMEFPVFLKHAEMYGWHGDLKLSVLSKYYY